MLMCTAGGAGDSKAKSVELTDIIELTRVPTVSPAFGFTFKAGKHEYSFYASSVAECTDWIKAMASNGAKPSRILAETTLELAGTNLEKFPKAHLVKQGLSTINLSSNLLTKLPEDFCSFAKLERLDLSSNQLKALPDAFGYLVALKTLNLHENALTALPPSFGRLSSLATLTLSSNKLTEVPSEIETFTNLESFSFSYNPVASGQVKPNLSKLQSLRFIDLSGCTLTSLPETLGSIPTLRVIEAFNNRIIDIPASFAQLSKLQRLNVARNKIASIAIVLPPTLEELDISHNPINELPKSVGSLTAFIEYAQCPLSSIPKESRSPLSTLKTYLSSLP